MPIKKGKRVTSLFIVYVHYSVVLFEFTKED